MICAVWLQFIPAGMKGGVKSNWMDTRVRQPHIYHFVVCVFWGVNYGLYRKQHQSSCALMRWLGSVWTFCGDSLHLRADWPASCKQWWFMCLLPDVDECEEEEARLCGAAGECVNNMGSYTCACPEGYRQISDTSCTGAPAEIWILWSKWSRNKAAFWVRHVTKMWF